MGPPRGRRSTRSPSRNHVIKVTHPLYPGGFQSLRERVQKVGARYVAVDIAGERKAKEREARRAAVVNYTTK